MLDRIKRKVFTYLNTEGRGNIKVERFNLLCHDAIQQRQDELINEIVRYENRENRGLGGNMLENLPDRTREKLLWWLTEDALTETSGAYTLPDDHAYLDDITDSDGTSLELTKGRKDFNIVKNYATSDYPVCYLTGSTLKTYPIGLGELTISYLRQPLKPKWTYTVVGNNELFNQSASDFVDADIHPTEEDEIVAKVLLACGINLKENDIVNVSMQKEQQEFNKDNAS